MLNPMRSNRWCPRYFILQGLRRQMLVSELLKYVKEIRSFDNGYGFRFDRSDDLEDLFRKMAEYIVFESLNSSQLTSAIDEEPKANGFWLQVRSLERQVSDGALASALSHT